MPTYAQESPHPLVRATHVTIAVHPHGSGIQKRKRVGLTCVALCAGDALAGEAAASLALGPANYVRSRHRGYAESRVLQWVRLTPRSAASLHSGSGSSAASCCSAAFVPHDLLPHCG